MTQAKGPTDDDRDGHKLVTKGEIKKVAKGVEAETLYSKEIAGASGRTLLELFPKKI